VSWRKLGLLLPAPPPVDWARSHLMVPVVETLGEERVRIYFTSKDDRGRSVVGRVTFDFPEGHRDYDPRPVLRPGSLGAFDDSGAMTSCLVHWNGLQYLYYIGWSRGVTVPFATFPGCAVSDDGGKTFERVSRAPILPRSDVDPFLASSPWVLPEEGRWRMWYTSGTGWTQTESGPKHWYNIKYAESSDGITWEPTGRVCIDFEDEREYALSRPFVLRENDRYRMWYSRRRDSYRIGYAESVDGLVWDRRDELAGVSVSEEGWDSEMIEYPFVVDVAGARYLLYNGNRYGETGVGYAILDAETP
jgi:hypothetical protein